MLSERGGESAGVEGDRNECWTCTVERAFLKIKIKRRKRRGRPAGPRPCQQGRAPLAQSDPAPATGLGPQRSRTPPQGPGSPVLSVFFILFYFILFYFCFFFTFLFCIFYFCLFCSFQSSVLLIFFFYFLIVVVFVPPFFS